MAGTALRSSIGRAEPKSHRPDGVRSRESRAAVDGCKPTPTVAEFEQCHAATARPAASASAEHRRDSPACAACPRLGLWFDSRGSLLAILQYWARHVSLSAVATFLLPRWPAAAVNLHLWGYFIDRQNSSNYSRSFYRLSSRKGKLAGAAWAPRALPGRFLLDRIVLVFRWTSMLLRS